MFESRLKYNAIISFHDAGPKCLRRHPTTEKRKL